ncbi:MAG: cell division protein FtsA [Helicobacteraceae bacterium]|nr:cell division protein FtsA [Helicobacteraceae bacterium]
MSKHVLVIDIGSTKICAIIAAIDENKEIQISGVGISKAQGLKKGSITNIDLASKSIKSALSDASRVAGVDVKSAIVSISGAYTKSVDSNGLVNIPNKEITTKEIYRAMSNSLYNASIPSEYEMLHTLPFNFKVDEQEFVEDPRGMNAARLDVTSHIIMVQRSSLSNLKKAVKAAGVDVQSVILSSYASSIAVLSEDEKELGVASVDIGGSTSNIVIHAGTSIKYDDFIGVGSNHITNDLSMALHTPLATAEEVKLAHGTLHTSTNDLIEIPVIGDENEKHEVSLEVVHNVIYARIEETLMIIAQSLDNSKLKESMGAGVVLTGGLTKIDGIRDLAIAVFGNMPVRLARPNNVKGLIDTMKDPSYSAAIGLVKYAAGAYTPYEIDVNKNMRHANEDKSITEFRSLENIATTKSSENVDTHSSKEPKMVNIEENKKINQDETSPISKFWNWATQLF